MTTRIWIFRIATGLLLLAGAGGCSRSVPEHQIVTAVDGEVRLPASLVKDGDAHFFTYKLDDKNINFFARTAASGKLLTHFDACYSCYQYKRGYLQKEREVVCMACQIGFDLDQDQWDWVGPCVPVTLQSRIRDDALVISVEKLENGARLF